MGRIIFEGDPPLDPVDVHSSSSRPTKDGVEVTLNVYVGGQPPQTVPVRVVLQPADAFALAGQMKANAGTVVQWQKN